MVAGAQDMHQPPCDPLVEVQGRMDAQEERIAGYIAQLDGRVGMMLRAAGETSEYAKNASRDSGRARTAAEQASKDATAARVAAEKTAQRVYAPVNEIIKKHDSNPAMSAALDYGDDAGEFTKSQPVPTLVKRMKEAEREKERIAEQVEALEKANRIEADRLMREAKEEKERLALANKLEIERLAREKQRLQIISAAIALAITIAGIISTILASRGH